MTDTMRAIVLDAPGPPDALTIRELPVPTPAAGWVLIEVKAFGLNRSELHTRQGLASGVTFPRVLGIEAAGVVAECPGGEFPVGQQVVTMMGGMGRTFDGGYAEYTCVPARQRLDRPRLLPDRLPAPRSAADRLPRRGRRPAPAGAAGVPGRRRRRRRRRTDRPRLPLRPDRGGTCRDGSRHHCRETRRHDLRQCSKRRQHGRRAERADSVMSPSTLKASKSPDCRHRRVRRFLPW